MSSRRASLAFVAVFCFTTALSAQQAGAAAMTMEPHGTFVGANKHTVSGSYHLATAGQQKVVELGDDFALDGAPDPYVVLSPTEKGDAQGAINLGRLKKPKGAQSYAVPAGTNLGGFTHVLIYCKKYNATLGQSELAGGSMKHSDGMMAHDSAMSH